MWQWEGRIGLFSTFSYLPSSEAPSTQPKILEESETILMSRKGRDWYQEVVMVSFFSFGANTEVKQNIRSILNIMYCPDSVMPFEDKPNLYGAQVLSSLVGLFR